MATATVHDTPLWGEYDVNDSRLGAYCDFLALVPAPTGGDTAVAASFLGPDTAVRGLLAVASAQRSAIAFRLPTGADEEAGTPIASAFVRGDRQRMVTLGAGVTHGIASGPTSVQDLADGHRTLVVLALDGDLARAVWQILWEATALPLAVDWAPALPAVLARHGVLVVARVHRAAAFAHPAAQVAVLDCDPVRLAAVISAAVRAGDLPIPPARIPYDSAAIPARLDDYLVAHGPALLRYLHRALPARHGAADPDDPRLAAFVRSPFPAQAMVTQGLAKTLAAEGAAIVSGEMGVGKTLMMAGATYLRHARPFRALVLCPPHLVPKWSREVGTTVPGATVTVLRSFGDLVRLRRLVGLTPTRPEFYVMARSQMARSATQGFSGVPATLRGALAKACPGLSGYRCPDCGAFLVTVTEGSRAEDDTSLRVWTAPFVRTIRKSNARCPACQTPLWAPVGAAAANRRAFLRGRAVAAPSANRSFRPYQYVKQHLRGVFDTLIVDEIHEYKGDTNRGSALGTLAAACGDVLMGTGTILGGYASHLAYLLFRTKASEVVAAGFTFGQVHAWVERYGTLEKVYRTSDARGQTGRAQTANKAEVRERPGVSPRVFADFLLPMMATIGLEDLKLALPDFDEDVIGVDMTPELRRAYQATIEPLATYVKAARFDPIDPGFRYQPILNVLRRLYGDQPFASAYAPVYSAVDPDRCLTTPVGLAEGMVYPKEQALVEEVRGQMAQRRRVLVYVEDTVTRTIVPRLQRILTAAIPGLVVAALPASVPPERREAWFTQAVTRGVQVVIVHPGLVETGLDLLAFPSLVFYQTTFNLFRMRQASRRSWRIGQPLPVRVRHLYYRDTAQAEAIILMGRKLFASLALEGRFGGSALLELAEADVQDGTTLAKQLAGSLTGEDVWDQLRARRPAIPGPVPVAPTPVPVARPPLRVVDPPSPSPAARGAGDGPGVVEQLSLFG